MATESFTCFSLLPKALRLQIWAETFEPRLITVTTELYGFSPRHLPRLLYLVGGDYAFSHFEVDDLDRPGTPHFTVHMYAKDVDTPIAFSVCQESRDAASTAGYRVWTMDSHINRLEARDVLWNPKLDIVFLPRQEDLAECCPQHLLGLYPQEAQLVERLAVDCCVEHLSVVLNWDFLLPHFRPLGALKEVIFLLDENEARPAMCRRENLGARMDMGIVWTTISDVNAWIEQCLVKFRQSMLDKPDASDEWKSWNPPVVRVAWGVDSITSFLLGT